MGGVTTAELSPIEARIVARARDFDLGPLLRLLEAEGYPSERIFFESNPELVASPALVAAVTFHHSPVRRVVVTLNLGLLGANSLLPSYFQHVADQMADPEVFYDFIRFFDHRLLEHFVRSIYPERDTALVGDWERTKSFYFRMLGLGSTATLQWLFQLHFPELRVWVSRKSFRSVSLGEDLRSGSSVLDGSSVLGSAYESETPGFQVDLLAEEDADPRAEGWPLVVDRRFREVLLPLLAPSRLHLEVGLTVASQNVFARLSEHSYLGYERLQGDGAMGHRMVIFLGDTSGPTRPPPPEPKPERPAGARRLSANAPPPGQR